jgi:hypothetical protein
VEISGLSQRGWVSLPWLLHSSLLRASCPSVYCMHTFLGSSWDLLPSWEAEVY